MTWAALLSDKSGLLKNFHWIVALALAVFLVPAFRVAHLNLQFPWLEFIYRFYVLLFIESMFLAILLFAVGHQSEFRKLLFENSSQKKAAPAELIHRLVVPGTYLFLVLLLTFAYNDVIATFRFDGTFDSVLNRMDSWLTGGWTVADLSRKVSPALCKRLESVYYQMFLQIGACLLIVATRHGRARVLQFVGAIATAYFLGLLLFYCLPATGPYYLSVLHPDGGYIGLGEAVVHKLKAIQERQIISVSTHWYVAFPCLHLAQPLIVLWFLRKSKVIAAILVAYDLALIPVILVLQAHYLVDLIGGVCVALLAVAMVDWSEISAP